MNTNDIREYLLSNSPWVDPNHTVDHVLAGDAQKQVRKVGVGWFPAIGNLVAAHEQGCDLYISHEPLFWDHWATGKYKAVEPALAKQRFLDKTGMVVLRAHDNWDNWPEIGIRDSWAKGLGLTNFIAEDVTRWHGVYQIKETTLKEFAKYVASKINVLGEDSVRVLGDPQMKVSRPSVGVGCGVPPGLCQAHEVAPRRPERTVGALCRAGEVVDVAAAGAGRARFPLVA